MHMTSKLTVAGVITPLFAFSILGCTAAEQRETAPPPSEAAASIMGTWNSDSTPGVKFHIESNQFGLGGLCASSGTWEKIDDTYATTVTAVPEIGGCPETMTLNVYEIKEFGLSENGQLVVTDSEGNREQFSKTGVSKTE